MKILQVIHGFPPHGMGGSEIYTFNLSKELAKNDEVHIFYRVANPNKPEYDLHLIQHNGLTLYEINNTPKHQAGFEQTYKNDVISNIFGDVLEKIKPDIVHVQHLMGLSTTLVAEAHQRKIPVLFTLHDFWLMCHLGQLLRLDLSICDDRSTAHCTQCLPPQLVVKGTFHRTINLMQRAGSILKNSVIQATLLKLFHQHYRKITSLFQKQNTTEMMRREIHIQEMCRLVDLFITPSEFLRAQFVAYGIPGEKLIHCPNGYNVTPFRGFTKVRSKKIRFGYIGMFIPSKGIHILIDAFNRIDAEDVELRIHGTSQPYHQGFIDYPAYLRALDQRKNISWFGKYDNKDIARILSKIDVLVVPSIWYENAPLTIQEAFLASVPVIASNIGGMKEMVKDGKNGLLFRVGDSGDLAVKMEKIIDYRNLINHFQRYIQPPPPMTEHVKTIRGFYRNLM